jgi:hypothetical protein
LAALAALMYISPDPLAIIPAHRWAWYRLSPGSLNLMQAVIERHVWKTLWDPVILTVLLQPVWLVLALPGLLLALFARSRKRRRFGRS